MHRQDCCRSKPGRFPARRWSADRKQGGSPSGAPSQAAGSCETAPPRITNDELCAATTDVEDKCRCPGQARTGHDAVKSQTRLVVTTEDLHLLGKSTDQVDRVVRLTDSTGGYNPYVATTVPLGQSKQLIHGVNRCPDGSGLKFSPYL